MKQKLALACTLVHEPELILLDEPTTGVDPVSRREFWKLLSEFLANGITILMSTPYLDEAERCTRVALVHEGRVLAADEPARLRELIPGRMLEVLAHGAAAADALRALPGVRDAQVFGERIHITLDDDSPAVRGAVQGRTARDAARRRAGASGAALSRRCVHRPALGRLAFAARGSARQAGRTLVRDRRLLVVLLLGRLRTGLAAPRRRTFPCCGSRSTRRRRVRGRRVIGSRRRGRVSRSRRPRWPCARPPTGP